MLTRTQCRIGEILFKDGLITSEQLQLALQEQSKSGGFLGSIMVKLGFIEEEALFSSLSRRIFAYSFCCI